MQPLKWHAVPMIFLVGRRKNRMSGQEMPQHMPQSRNPESKKRGSHFRSSLWQFLLSRLSVKQKSILPSSTLLLSDLASESSDTSAALQKKGREDIAIHWKQ